MKTRTIIRATSPGIFGPEIAFKIGQKIHTDDGVRISIAKPLELETIDTSCTTDHIPPTFSLMPDEAQQFMDELWHVGIRPSEGSGSAGQMAATQKHLEDMRSLVFKTPPKQ